MSGSMDVLVRLSAGEYSCRKGKLSGSSTMGPRWAAERLAEKLFPARVTGVTEVEGRPPAAGQSWWRIEYLNS